jgi:hypothetical protein
MAVRFMKPRTYGTAKEIVARAYGQVTGGIEAVMTILNIGRTRAHALADPQEPREQIAYAEARQLTKGGAVAFAEDLALLAGGVFVPQACAPGVSIEELTAESARQFGEKLACAVRALANGRLTAREIEKWLRETDDVVRVVTQLRAELNERLHPTATPAAAE